MATRNPNANSGSREVRVRTSPHRKSAQLCGSLVEWKYACQAWHATYTKSTAITAVGKLHHLRRRQHVLRILDVKPAPRRSGAHRQQRLRDARNMRTPQGNQLNRPPLGQPRLSHVAVRVVQQPTSPMPLGANNREKVSCSQLGVEQTLSTPAAGLQPP